MACGWLDWGEGNWAASHAGISSGWTRDESYHQEERQDSRACGVIHVIPVEAGLAERGTQPETKTALCEVQERLLKTFLPLGRAQKTPDDAPALLAEFHIP